MESVMSSDQVDIIVIGAGPAGMLAALRSADLGARTALVARAEFGGIAINDGPVPVRTLSQAARLMREARQLGRYGVAVSEPVLDYPRLLARVREVVDDVRAHIAVHQWIDALGVTVHEQAGTARFADPHTIVTEAGLRLQADKIIICTGSRRLPLPGFELTSTHSDAWGLTSVPPSMLVIGAGDTWLQVASIFNTFGSRIQLLEAGPRILPHADVDLAGAVTAAFRGSGMVVQENFGAIESFEKTAAGVRMIFSKDGHRGSAEAAQTAQKLAEKPAAALQACKRLMRRPLREQLELAAKFENEEFAARVRSADTKEAFTAFLEKRPPDFTRTKQTATVA
jgi:pyruvate/2-oxoglutarate dehydrogenase complex dihydrolipoamide dehydrogenase (E3) component